MAEETYRALLVDDQPDSVEALAILLEQHRCAAQVVTSGAAALAAMDDFQPLCVLLDLGMPEMSGLELARALRARQGSDLVLIAVTGRSGQETVDEAMRAGIDYVLTKPVDLKQVCRIMGLPVQP